MGVLDDDFYSCILIDASDTVRTILRQIGITYAPFGFLFYFLCLGSDVILHEIGKFTIKVSSEI
jgi:hypothetical protein